MLFISIYKVKFLASIIRAQFRFEIQTCDNPLRQRQTEPEMSCADLLFTNVEQKAQSERAALTADSVTVNKAN